MGEQSSFLECPGQEALIKARGSVRTNDRVVVPAHNEARYIGGVITYLLRVIGFAPEQIFVVDSRSTDETAKAARIAGVPTENVINEEQVFELMLADGRRFWEYLQSECGVTKDRLRGKGTAVYAGLLTLAVRSWLQGDGRLFLLDADLVNLEASDPVSALLHALCTMPAKQYAKCSMYHMGLDGIDALLAGVPHPPYFHQYLGVQALLGGQVVFTDMQLLGDLRFPTAYGLELACHLQAVDRHGPDGVVLVNIAASLEHDVGTLAGYTVMDMCLLEFAVRVANRRVPLLSYDPDLLRRHNAHFAGLEVSARNGEEFATAKMDMLLPPITTVLSLLVDRSGESMQDSVHALAGRATSWE